MFWVSKYQPQTLEDLDYNPEVTKKLVSLSNIDNDSNTFPHTIFAGPSGAGKKTRIMALLRKFYGPGVDHVRIDRRNFKTRSNKPIELKTIQSNFHIEINPSDVGVHDEIVVQEIIKEIAEYRSLNGSFKVVVITEADKLSHRAQHGLRATIEKYSAFCKIIMCTESLSKIIDPILSRCFIIRVRSPTHKEMCTVLENVSKKEGLENDNDIIQEIVSKSDHNLRRALLMLQAYSEDENNTIPVSDWEVHIDNMTNMIIKKQDPKTLLEARSKMYELLSNCIPATIIFKRVLYHLLKNISSGDELKREIVKNAVKYEAECTKGQKDIYFLEAFVAKVLYLLASNK